MMYEDVPKLESQLMCLACSFRDILKRKNWCYQISGATCCDFQEYYQKYDDTMFGRFHRNLDLTPNTFRLFLVDEQKVVYEGNCDDFLTMSKDEICEIGENH